MGTPVLTPAPQSLTSVSGTAGHHHQARVNFGGAVLPRGSYCQGAKKPSHICALSGTASANYSSIIEQLLKAIVDNNLTKREVVAMRDKLVAA
jgi:hypothetical protein